MNVGAKKLNQAGFQGDVAQNWAHFKNPPIHQFSMENCGGLSKCHLQKMEATWRRVTDDHFMIPFMMPHQTPPYSKVDWRSMRIYCFFGRNRALNSGYSMKLWKIERCGDTLHAAGR